MNGQRILSFLFGLGLILGCSGILAQEASTSGGAAGRGAPPSGAAESRPAHKNEAVKGEQRGQTSRTRGSALLYPVNRLLDLFDLARVGLNVGPGFGLEVKASDWVRIAAISDTSIGVGFQSLRHLPVCARSRAKVAIGPLAAPAVVGYDWPSQFWDVGLEVHLFVVGFHVYLNPKEMVDFAGGWALFDPMDDDFRVEGKPNGVTKTGAGTSKM